MKHFTFKLFVAAALCFVFAKASAYDFKSGNIYYNKTGGNTCETTAFLIDYYEDGTIRSWIPCSVTGNLVIPSEVENDGVTYTVTGIGDCTFGSCRGLESVTMPNTVTYIGNNAFFACEQLANVNIPEKVSSIGQLAFGLCGMLPNVDIPNSVESIGQSAFEQCSSLQKVDIPNSVRSIGPNAFQQCSITEIVIPNTVENLGSWAFANCSGLSHATLEDGNTDLVVGCGIFNECNRLESLYLGRNLFSKGDLMSDGSMYKAVICSHGLKRVVIGNTVTKIAEETFQACDNLTDVEISNSVITIEPNAFFACKKLERINIPNSVETIGERAFQLCTMLEEVGLGSGLREIGTAAMVQCPNLMEVTCNSVVPPSVASTWAFDDDAYYRVKLFVPGQSYDDYKAHEVWGRFLKIQEFEPTGISGTMLKDAIDSVRVFDLQGRKLPKPVRGLNIIDGKKVVVE